jgi:hypothetical protein
MAMLELLKRKYNRATFWEQLAAQQAGPVVPAAVERKKGSWLSR